MATLLRRFLAGVLAVAVAAEPALAAGLEAPGAAAEPPPRATPVPLVRPGLEAPLTLPTLSEAVVLPEGQTQALPAALPTAGLPTASANLGAAEAARARVARAQAIPFAAAKPAAVSPAKDAARAEFGGLRSGERGALSERVWEHAESRGFERESALSAWANEGGAPTPLERPAAGPSSPSAPAPPAPKKTERLSVMSGRVLGFLSNFLLLQLAVESLALAVPQMTDPLSNGFIALAKLAATSYAAYSAGSFVGGRLVQWLGLANVYRSVLLLRTALWGGVALLFHAGHGAISIPLLIGFFAGDYLVHSIGRVAERTLQREWFKGSPVASNKFGTLRDFIEYGTVLTTMGTGLIISMFGFGAVIYTVPFLFAGAAAMAIALRGLPNKLSEKGGAPLLEGFKDLFGPRLRTLFVTRLLINNFVYLLYYMTATAFGVFAAHGNTGFAALAASALIGLLGMGANAAALGNAAVSRGIEKKTEGIEDPALRTEAQTRLMSESVVRALRWAALGILGGWLFLSGAQFGTVGQAVIALAPLAAAGGLIGALAILAKAARAGATSRATALSAAKWAGVGLLGTAALLLKAHVASLFVWPLFAVSPALILIGLTGQLALTQLDTLMTEKMPEHNKAYVVGADRTLTNLSYVFNFLLWGVLFQLFGAGAFWGLGVYCTLTAAAYLWLSRSLKKQAK